MILQADKVICDMILFYLFLRKKASIYNKSFFSLRKKAGTFIPALLTFPVFPVQRGRGLLREVSRRPINICTQ